jgi:hypothetical protein
MARKKHLKKTRHYMKKTQKRHKRRTRKCRMRGGSVKPLIKVGSGLFEHMNFSNGFVPNILGDLSKHANYLWRGKPLFKDFYPNILNLGTK